MTGSQRICHRRAGWTLLLTASLAGCSETVSEADGGGSDCATATVPYPDRLTQTGSVQHVHDPAILRQGDWYYVFSTNDGIPIRRSRDLVQWERVGRVFPDQLPPWARGEVPGVVAPWAPDIAYFNGKYHLYYSLSTFGGQRSVIGLATSATLDPSSPQYRWEDQGKVLESWPGVSDHNAIDPNVAFDERGQPWLSWGSYWSGIKLRRLDPSTGRLSRTDTVQYALASRRGAGDAVEAPVIIRRGEFFYLFVSFDACCRAAESTYNVRVGRSRSITGPYTDREGVPMMQGGGTLVLSGYGRVRGPGHNSILTEGGQELLVHHFYDAQDGGVPKLQVRPLVWDERGWPVAAEPLGSDAAGGGASPVGSWGYWTDNSYSLPTRVELLGDGRARRCDADGTWSLAHPWLTLRWSSGGAGGGARTEVLRLSPGGGHFVGRAEDGGIVRGYRLQGP